MVVYDANFRRNSEQGPCYGVIKDNYGAAKLLVPEAANPGAESYFADSLMIDREGTPWMVALALGCAPKGDELAVPRRAALRTTHAKM